MELCNEEPDRIPVGEVISIHLGQAGIQTGNAIWELLAGEHYLQPNGTVKVDQLKHVDQSAMNGFFSETIHGYVPRSIFADLEPTVVDEIRTGFYRNLFNCDTLLNATEDAANLYSRGRYCIGNILEAPLGQLVRNSVEDCENLRSFMLHHAIGGGTGSGLATILFDLMEDYRKKTRIAFSLYPSSKLSSSILEPYNSILCSHQATEAEDVEIVLDNDAIYQICEKHLLINNPSYRHVNQIIGQAVSTCTACSRFPNSLYADVDTMMTNLVPYPRIHFPTCSMSPFCCASVADHEKLSISQITRACFRPTNELATVHNLEGRFMSCCIMYRGEVDPSQVYPSLEEIKKDTRFEFVDWVPTGFKVGICDQASCTVGNSGIHSFGINCAMLSNNSNMAGFLNRITNRFEMMFAKRAYVHWYLTDGMEEDEFTDAVENIKTLVVDYQEIANTTPVACAAGDSSTEPEPVNSRTVDDAPISTAPLETTVA